LDQGHQFLYCHLPAETWVYDLRASQALQRPVWFELRSGVGGSGLLGRNFVWCYDKWFVGHITDPSIGYLTYDDGSHWGTTVNWEFYTPIIYNEGRRALIHELELVGTVGHSATEQTISTAYSVDGVNFGSNVTIDAGAPAEYNKRLVWINQGVVDNVRVQRFTGNSDTNLSFLRLEAKMEGLNV